MDVIDQSGAFFILAYEWYDENIPIFLIGPEDVTENDFKGITQELLNVSAQKALENSKKDSYIGWEQIVIEMSKLLSNKGFTVIKPKRVAYWGSCIIDEQDLSTEGDAPDHYNLECIDDDILKEIIKHNTTKDN